MEGLEKRAWRKSPIVTGLAQDRPGCSRQGKSLIWEQGRGVRAGEGALEGTSYQAGKAHSLPTYRVRHLGAREALRPLWL